MTIKENLIFKFFFVFFISLRLAAGQPAIALDKDDEFGDYREKIINTARELGIGVYEDLSVEFAGEEIIFSEPVNFGQTFEVSPSAFAYADENNQNGFGKGQEFKIGQTAIKRYDVSAGRDMPKTAVEEKAGESSLFRGFFTGVRNFFGSIFKKNNQTDSQRTEQPQIPKKKSSSSLADKLTGGIATFFYTFKAKIMDSGFFPWTIAAPSFDEISKNAIAMVKNSGFKPRKVGQTSLLKEEGFIKELETLTGAKFTEGNTVKFLIDGKASFAIRDKLIREAKKSVYIGTFIFHDDITGNETADMLVAKKNEGVDVKIILDHKIAYMLGTKVIKRMQKAGIEIIRHMDSKRTGDYWHVKLLIVDDKYAVVGGINYGDSYSHKDPDGQKWRDTDVFYSGLAVMETKKIFAENWNSKVMESGLDFGKVDMDISPSPGFDKGSARIAVVFQNPPNASSSPVLFSILKAIYGATERVNIENAYFIAIPAVSQAILDAKARGVKVNILTNSEKTIDGDCDYMANSIIKGLIPLIHEGINVYLKKGNTLHSKFMTVDGVFCSIGSYNLRPRSERYDTELNVNVIDHISVRKLEEVFAKDISEATKINSVEDLNYKPTWLSKIMEKYFYAMLSPEK